MSNQPQALTWEMARPIVASNQKQYEAALLPDPSQGRYRPFGYGAWMSAVKVDFQKQPKLVEAALQAPETVHECLGVAANAGLMVGAANGQFYLIPRWNGRKKRMECTFIVGYRGMCELAMRHPRVHKIEAFLVYEGEPFEFDPGAGKLSHKMRFDVDRSDEKLIAAYSRVVLTVGNGGTVTDPEPLFWVMTRAELLKARDRSDGWTAFSNGKIQSTPWSTDFAAMCRKTVMRRHFSGGSVPRSSDLILAMTQEIEHEEKMVEIEPQAPVQVAAAGLRQALGMTPPADSIDADFEREAARVVDGPNATE